eukprot:gene10930-biopygen11195
MVGQAACCLAVLEADSDGLRICDCNWPGTSGTCISDGGGDMYDCGNQINVVSSAGTSSTQLPYRQSTTLGSSGNGDIEYTTYKASGMWLAVFHSASGSLAEYYTSGNNGADGGGSQASGYLGEYEGYHGWYKKVYNAYDPSINEIIITTDGTWTQSIGSSTNDGMHRLRSSGRGGVSEIFYLMWAGSGGHSYSTSTMRQVMQAFIQGCASSLTAAPSTRVPTMEPPPPYCRSTGDPHFRTFSGRRFDFHGLGDYTLLDLTGGAHPMQLHACQQDAAPRWTGAAANTMLAIRLDGPNATTILVRPRHPAPGVNITASPVALEDLSGGVSVTEAVVGSGRWATTRTLITLPSGLEVAVQSWGSSRGGATKLFLSVYVQLPRVGAAREGGAFQGEGLCGPVEYDGMWYDTSNDLQYDSSALFARSKVAHNASMFRAGGVNLCTGNSYFEPLTPLQVEERLNETGTSRVLVEAQCAGVCADKVEECVMDAALTGDVTGVVNESLAACGMGTEMDGERCLEAGTCSMAPTASPTTSAPTTVPPTTDSPTTAVPSSSPTTSFPSVVPVPCRVTGNNVQSGLQVVRGDGWSWGNQDGGSGNQGIILVVSSSCAGGSWWRV